MLTEKGRELYFNFDEIQSALNDYRGWAIELCFDKKDKSERILKGVLCYGNGRFLVSEGTDEKGNPIFKAFGADRVKWIKVNGIKYSPR